MLRSLLPLLFAAGILLTTSGSIPTAPLPISTGEDPVRIGIVGLVHSHVVWLLRTLNDRPGVEVVGIAEPDRELALRYAEQYGFDPALIYPSLEALLDEARPQAVTVFTSTFDHAQVVEASAPRGVHVMVEKPLAVNLNHAQRIEAAAREHGIQVLTNYETTWYPSMYETYALASRDRTLGTLRKFVVHDGHRGPREIGVPPEFLEWLLDPVLNGGGALMDFGCYGANLITWLLDNQRPTTVSAVTQQLKSDSLYARVDDEATIVVMYPEAQGIIQASWNWPFNRKDLEVYGDAGYVYALDGHQMRVRIGDQPVEDRTLDPGSGPDHDPFLHLAAVVRGDIEPNGLSSLENNLIVVEILDAARRSAETGQTIVLDSATE